MADSRWRRITIRKCLPSECPHCTVPFTSIDQRVTYMMCHATGKFIAFDEKGEGFPEFCPLTAINEADGSENGPR